MSRRIHMAAVSDMGNVRANNEDNLYFNQNYLPVDHPGTDGILTDVRILSGKEAVAVGVFDGMGGEAYGEEASYRAARRFAEEMPYFDGSDMTVCFFDICRKMNADVVSLLAEKRCSRTGSTGAVVGITEKEICCCNLGDSRIYGLQDGRLMQISEDHTNENMLKEVGIVGQKPQLTQFLGVPVEQFELEPFIRRIATDDLDKILICSDGLTDMVERERIQSVLAKAGPAEACEILTAAAKANGGRDNITMIIIDLQTDRSTYAYETVYPQADAGADISQVDMPEKKRSAADLVSEIIIFLGMAVIAYGGWSWILR